MDGSSSSWIWINNTGSRIQHFTFFFSSSPRAVAEGTPLLHQHGANADADADADDGVDEFDAESVSSRTLVAKITQLLMALAAMNIHLVPVPEDTELVDDENTSYVIDSIVIKRGRNEQQVSTITIDSN